VTHHFIMSAPERDKKEREYLSKPLHSWRLNKKHREIKVDADESIWHHLIIPKTQISSFQTCHAGNRIGYTYAQYKTQSLDGMLAPNLHT
jgi:hypothetical protein